jgi:anti-anti-sigma factor
MYATIECPTPGLAVCRLSGSLDLQQLEGLRAVMAACAAFPIVHLDLSGVVFIDSGGLGVLVGGIRRIYERMGAVVAWGARANIQRVLTATGFVGVVPLRDGSAIEFGTSAVIAS